jgi:tRNA 2-selenouridine synthase
MGDFPVKDVRMEELLVQGYGNLIDVRSPGEYARETIPGAVNIPLFSDEERKMVGITYKREGQAAAQWLGMQLVSPKLEALLSSIRERWQETGEVPTVFCWRGGLRSRAVATFASFAGIPVQRLAGGYRAYRQHVVKFMEPVEWNVPLVLLHGMTGVGKTELLRRLQQKGHPVLDLERMAGHRGSVFGHLGKGVPANQKMFDARLFETLRQYSDAPYFIMEAESKRIGHAVVPAFLLQAKQHAHHLSLQAPIEVRVERLMKEYVYPLLDHPHFHERVVEAYRHIAMRIPTAQAKMLQQALDNRDYREAIVILLTFYYDPRYLNKRGEYAGQMTEIDATDLDQATEAVERFIASRFP